MPWHVNLFQLIWIFQTNGLAPCCSPWAGRNDSLPIDVIDVIGERPSIDERSAADRLTRNSHLHLLILINLIQLKLDSDWILSIKWRHGFASVEFDPNGRAAPESPAHELRSLAGR